MGDPKENNSILDRLRGMFSETETNASKHTEYGTADGDTTSIPDDLTQERVKPLDELKPVHKPRQLTEQEIEPERLEVQQEETKDVRFAKRFLIQGGRIIYCESLKDVVEQVVELKKQAGWNYIYEWELPLKMLFNKHRFQRGTVGVTMEHSDVAISLCHAGIAESGTILLNPDQSSQRRFHVFPKIHLLLMSTEQIHDTLADAVHDFKDMYPNELPSLLDLGDKFENNKEGIDTLILNAVGTRNVIVLICDEHLV